MVLKEIDVKNIQMYDDRTIRVWQELYQEQALSAEQENLFLAYLSLLQDRNELTNLTSIVQPHSIILYHFQDSLELGNVVDMSRINMIADVGSGAGFPGIPLAIKWPHIKVMLIEVNTKKIAFLNDVITTLGLKNVEVYTQDWRTFLRIIDYPIDLFLARASLQPEELLRMFKPGCVYNQRSLIYWASKEWEAGPTETIYKEKEIWYSVGHKKRKLVFFKLSK